MNGPEKEVIVLGGGVAGLTAAKAMADIGIRVNLVDKSEALGGHAAQWACMATDECAKCSACLIQRLIGEVLTHPGINPVLGARLESVKRNAKDYVISLSPGTNGSPARGRPDPSILKNRCDVAGKSIVVATGFDEYDPTGAPLLGYGRFEGVVTTRDLDHMLRQDDISSFLPAEIRNPKVAFIQCVGSRDKADGREYCSQFCCRTSIRLVRRLSYLNPEVDATIFFIDLQIMSKEFVHFYQKARGSIRFIQGVPAEVFRGETDGKLVLFGTPPGADRAQALEFDRVVLAIGLSPTLSHRFLASKLDLTLNELGHFSTPDTSGGKTDGLAGVFVAGACGGPTDIQGSRKQALAVAVQVARAIGIDGSHSDIKARWQKPFSRTGN